MIGGCKIRICMAIYMVQSWFKSDGGGGNDDDDRRRRRRLETHVLEY